MISSEYAGSPTLAWGVGRWRRVARCARALAASRPTSPVTAMISVPGACMPALAVADTPPPRRSASFQVIGFRVKVNLLAVRYYLQLGAAAERIAGLLADRGVDISGRTIVRWVQKFGPALAAEVQRHLRMVARTWLVDDLREDPRQVALPVSGHRSRRSGATCECCRKWLGLLRSRRRWSRSDRRAAPCRLLRARRRYP
jgi:hypothetical protein